MHGSMPPGGYQSPPGRKIQSELPFGNRPQLTSETASFSTEEMATELAVVQAVASALFNEFGIGNQASFTDIFRHNPQEVLAVLESDECRAAEAAAAPALQAAPPAASAAPSTQP